MPIHCKIWSREDFPFQSHRQCRKMRAGWTKAEKVETDSVTHRCGLRPCLNLFISKTVVCEKLLSGLENDSVGKELAGHKCGPEFRSPARTEEACCYDSRNPSTGWSEKEKLLGTHWLARDSVKAPDSNKMVESCRGRHLTPNSGHHANRHICMHTQKNIHHTQCTYSCTHTKRYW